MDRQAASRALAKAIAYVDCGKAEQAEVWLTALTEMFAEEGVYPTVAAAEDRPAPVQYDLSAAATRFGSQLL